MNAPIRDPRVSSRIGEPGARVAFCAMLLGLALGILGCQSSGQKQSATGANPPAMPAAGTGTPRPIALTWDQQNSCVNFNPSNLTIQVGDQVQFNSSLTETVTIRVDPAAFGAADTVITVGQGANQTTHQAQTAGTYMWHSTPTACATTGGGPGPSVIINEGGQGTNK